MRLPPLASFWSDHRDVITAIVTAVLAFVVAHFVDRAVARRAAAVASRMGAGVSPVASTRLRLVRRLLYVTIVVIGLALALAQFAALQRLAAGVLASSAVLGLIFGFAARQTFANAIAGILLAITQPIRIGDLVTFENTTGTVDDIRLTYTYIATDAGTRFVVPNERLAQSTVVNHTLVGTRVSVEVSLWLPPGADANRALDVLSREEGVDAEIAGVDKDGITISARTWAPSAAERGAIAARLRASGLERLRALDRDAPGQTE